MAHQGASRFSLPHNSSILTQLTRLLAGKTPILVRGRQVHVQPLGNLTLLSRTAIERSEDPTLTSLLSRTLDEHRTRGFPTWTQYQDAAGSRWNVVQYHGMPLNHRIISGNANETDDLHLLRAVVLAHVEVSYNGQPARLRAPRDAYLLAGYLREFREQWWVPELLPMWRRASNRSKKGTGTSPTRMLEDVLNDSMVSSRLGITLRHVRAFALEERLKEYLRPRVIGERPFVLGGRLVCMTPGNGDHLLSPTAAGGDARLAAFYHQLFGYHDVGVDYWAAVAAVRQELSSVNYHGSASFGGRDQVTRASLLHARASRS